MGKPQILAGLAVAICLAAACRVGAQGGRDNTRYMVHIIGYAGRVEEKHGPFASYREAQDWGRQWSVSRPQDLRLWSVVELRPGQNADGALDQLLAEGTARLDALLQRTRKTARIAGHNIPHAGQVLNEYRKTIENSYASAKALQDGLVKFHGKGTGQLFGRLNELVRDRLELESDLYVQRARVDFADRYLREQENARGEHAEINRLLDEIASTTDPEKQAALLVRLEELQKAGELREAAVSENEYRQAKDDAANARRIADSISRMVEENGEQQLEIVGAIRAFASIVGTWRGRSNYGALGTPQYDRRAVTFVFKRNGTVRTSLAGNGLGSEGTWKFEGNSVEITWSRGSLDGAGSVSRLRLAGGQLVGSGRTGRGHPWSVSCERD